MRFVNVFAIAMVFCLPFAATADCTWSTLIGDANGDRQITPGDALEFFWASINGDWQEMVNYCCLDANKDGVVTPGDALMVFWYSIYQESTENVTGYVGRPCRVNTAPAASFTVDPMSGTVNTVFNFDASGCFDNEDPLSILQVHWDWENDGTYDTEWDTTKVASHQYSTEGAKTVRLEVKDAEGLTDTETKEVSIEQFKAPTLASPYNSNKINDNTPTFDWNNVAGAVTYELMVDDNSDFGSPEISQVDLASSTYTSGDSLLDGTYYWKARAKDILDNWSPWSDDWAVTIDTQPPIVPTLVSPTSGARTNDTTPTFDWSSVAGATKYHLQVKYGLDNMAVNDSTLTASSYTPPSGMADMTYYWQVRARDAAGNWSDWASTWAVTIDTRAPEVPTLLSPANGDSTNDNTPTFDWGDVPKATKYHLQLEYGFGNMIVDDSTLTISTYTALSSIVDMTYYWRVRSGDIAGNWSEWTNAWAVTIDTRPPDVPILISPADGSNTNDNTPTFDWGNAARAIVYELIVDNDSDFSSPEISKNTLYSSTYTPDSSLSDGAYHWKARAKDVLDNWGGWSTDWTVTIDTRPPEVPTLISPTCGSTSNDKTPTFDWSDVAGATRYHLQVTHGFGDMVVDDSTLTIWTYTLPSGIPDMTYYWRVRACDAVENWSNWSAECSLAILDIHGTVVDIDGNVYATVVIGTQEWMAENLRVTHYRNGDAIPNVIDDSAWTFPDMITGACCNYDNDINNVAIFGRIYNGYAVMDSRNIAPEGWHVPTDEEWKQLEMYLGMSQSQANAKLCRGTDEGGKIKEDGTWYWRYPNTGATNECGFSAFPAGYRETLGRFYELGESAWFWSSTEYTEYENKLTWARSLYFNHSGICRRGTAKQAGYSVRCVKG